MKHSLCDVRSRRCAGLSWRVRSAFTLLELLLALAIIVTLATLSLPDLLRSLKQQGVQGSAEQVRQILDHARVRAVEEGRILQFRFEPNGTHYVLLPLEPVAPASSSTTSPTSNPIDQQPVGTTDPFRIYKLSQGCTFHVDSSLLSGEKTVSERLDDAWLNSVENPEDGRDVAWAVPILYSPDGSATDGTLVIMDRDRQYVRLRVRGLTGAVWTDPLAVMAERLGTTGP